MFHYDLLIKGGEVVIPATSTKGRLDVAIADGRIVAIKADIPPTEAKQVVDAKGKLVVPGLIDLHTHLGFELHTQVVDANHYCPAAGVTTAIDQGSTGAFTFPWFRERAIGRAVTRLRAFINIASLGTIAIHKPYYVDFYGRYIDIDDTVRTIQENRAHIWGIKVFATSAMVGQWALGAVRAAVQVGEAVGLPVTVHVSVAPPSTEEVLNLLRPGDIITHTYTPYDQGILDDQGRLKACVREARERGVLFDLGHGAGSFTFAVARQAIEQGFLPDTISTDVYYSNLDGPVYDLPTTLSKFLNLGLPLEDVLARATCNAARALNRPQLGTLQLASPADVTILRLHEGRFSFVDSRQEVLTGRWKLECEATIFGGKIVYQRSAS